MYTYTLYMYIYIYTYIYIYIHTLFIMTLIINIAFHKHMQVTYILANTHANHLNMCKNACKSSK